MNKTEMCPKLPHCTSYPMFTGILFHSHILHIGPTLGGPGAQGGGNLEAIHGLQDDPGLDNEIETMGIGQEVHRHGHGHAYGHGSHGTYRIVLIFL